MPNLVKPERIGNEQIRALEKLHGQLGRSFAAALAPLVRTTVDINLLRIDQLTYSEFTFSLESPTCFNLLRIGPTSGCWLLELNLAILYPIIDRMLGGSGQSALPARRPLTQIEWRLVSRITNLFLQELRSAWQGTAPLDVCVERVESNPQLLHVVPPNDMVALVRFEVTLGQSRGSMNLCIPLKSLVEIDAKLHGDTICPATGSNSVVELVACLAETKISAEDLANLRVGDIIATEQSVDTPLMVRVDGALKYHARAGAFKRHKAIQIESAVPDTDANT